MQNKLKQLFACLICLVSINGFAHSPDISSLMMYEQNGKQFLAIRSALTAFEGEVDYHFKKNAYKTPEEFQQFVVQLFQKNCFLSVNNDTVTFLQPTAVLGHETTVFAELSNLPKKITSIHVSNTLFADMPNNQCEFVLMLNGYPQKQFILSSDNAHAVSLSLEHENWVVEKAQKAFLTTSTLLLFGLFMAIALAIWFFGKRKTTASRVWASAGK